MTVHAWFLRREINGLISAQAEQHVPKQHWISRELAKKQALYYRLTGTVWPPGSSVPA
jgi:hypothetical protein